MRCQLVSWTECRIRVADSSARVDAVPDLGRIRALAQVVDLGAGAVLVLVDRHAGAADALEELAVGARRARIVGVAAEQHGTDGIEHVVSSEEKRLKLRSKNDDL